MTSPEHAEYSTIWLGTPDTASADGVYPVSGPVRVSRLGVFDRKLTIGDATKDSDDFISSWVVSDFSGGGQVENINEGSDTTRFYDGTAETRFMNQVTPPPRMDIDAAGGYPIGDIGSHFYAAAGENGKTLTAYFQGEATTPVATTAMTEIPGGPGVLFQGTAATAKVYIPWLLGGGYSKAHESDATTIVVSNHPSTNTVTDDGTGSPSPVSFKALDLTLYCIDVNGYLWATTDGATWKARRDEFNSGYLKIPTGETPHRLEVFYYTDNQPSIHLITNRNVYLYNSIAGRWELTNLQFPPHPDFGIASCVWRPGEDFWISAGIDAVRMTAAGVIVPMTGLGRDDGVPWGFAGKISQFVPEASCLYAIVKPTMVDPEPVFANRQFDTSVPSETPGEYTLTNPPASGIVSYLKTHRFGALYAWTGIGWHRLWELDYQAGDISWACISSVNEMDYRLYIGTSLGMVSMKLRRTFHNPKQGWQAGIDRFADKGYFETGRFDANMRGFSKLASHLTVFAENANANATITVYYRTNTTMAAYQDDPIANPNEWVLLGEVNQTGSTILNFNEVSASGYEGMFARGVQFSWIQFRVVLELTDAADPPILEHFVFHYTKIPEDTSSFIFEVPLPEETFLGRTAQKMASDLAALIESNQFCIFKHQGKQYRVRVAGVAGSEPSGDEGGGVRQVNLIEIKQGA